MSGAPEVGMRCARSSEVGVLLGLRLLLVCAAFDVLIRTRRRYINVMGCRSDPGGLLDGKVGGGLAHKVVVGVGSASWVMLASS